MSHDELVKELLQYIYDANPLAEDAKPLPLDKSLYDLGILDSFAVVELVSFIESHWDIRILDAELTKEKFGGVNKMARLIGEKVAQRDTYEIDAH